MESTREIRKKILFIPSEVGGVLTLGVNTVCLVRAAGAGVTTGADEGGTPESTAARN